MRASVRAASPEHEVAYNDLVALMRRHADRVSAMELLAIAANVVGKMIAMQDQRTVTAEMAMELVAKNIEAGNQQVLRNLGNSQGRS